MNSAGQKIALICGVSGQDGSYLASFLLKKGYRVYGTSRDKEIRKFKSHVFLGIADRIELVSMSLNDFRSVLQVLSDVRPDEIYNLAGQSSVGLSFSQPVETLESITIGTLNLLECIRFLNFDTKLYSASSSECFGDAGGLRCNESTPFRPNSPYAVAKAAAYWEVDNYRSAYGLKACSGILFNHESPLRPERFVTQKIVRAAVKISREGRGKLRLGNLEISRDWGWAPEYVEAMWLMLQCDQPRDYVIATGKSYTLSQFADLAFKSVGLEWQNHVEVDRSLIRPTDIIIGRADPTRAFEDLGWKAETSFEDVVFEMVRYAASIDQDLNKVDVN